MSALALAAANVQAAVYDFGVHDPLEFSAFVAPGAGTVAPGSFEDFYTFEIPGGGLSVSSTVVTNNNRSFLSITGGQYGVYSFGTDGLFNAGAGDDLLLPGSAYAYDGTTGSTGHALTLGAGKYYYAVTGTGSGSFGGYYTLSSTTSAVPELETYLLMLAGIGALALKGARQQRT